VVFISESRPQCCKRAARFAAIPFQRVPPVNVYCWWKFNMRWRQ
jgi:hypothetical protein